MLLAIDAGNTQTVYGLWSGREWLAIWRRSTEADETEDQLAGWLKLMFDLSSHAFKVDQVVVASVVPALDGALNSLGLKWFDTQPLFLRSGDQVGLKVDYDPPHAVGADRLANSLAALQGFKPPLIAVDFGTATTFDILDTNGAYIGGAIMPGVAVSAQALAGRTAKLPQIKLTPPKTAIGKTTVHALQSGIMFGYASAVDGLVRRIGCELKEIPTVLATGGLGGAFLGLCETIERYEPTLTLDGLVIAAERLYRH